MLNIYTRATSEAVRGFYVKHFYLMSENIIIWNTWSANFRSFLSLTTPRNVGSHTGIHRYKNSTFFLFLSYLYIYFKLGQNITTFCYSKQSLVEKERVFPSKISFSHKSLRLRPKRVVNTRLGFNRRTGNYSIGIKGSFRSNKIK